MRSAAAAEVEDMQRKKHCDHSVERSIHVIKNLTTWL